MAHGPVADRHNRLTAGRLGLLALIVALTALLAACGSGAALAPPGENVDGDMAGQPAGEAAGDEGERSSDGQAPLADLVDRAIVKTGEITLEVEAVAKAVGEVRALTIDLGGYVGGSRSGNADDAATLTLRIPADRFDAAIEALHEMDAEIVAEATREEDVTASVVDLEARIRNLQASEAQYRALLERAEEIDDILTVQSRLDDVRGRIEQLQAQLEQLSGQADLATLTVTLVPAAAPVEETASSWDAGEILESAVAALVGVGQALAAAAIWLGIVGIPLLAAAGLLVLIGARAAPAIRRRPLNPVDRG